MATNSYSGGLIRVNTVHSDATDVEVISWSKDTNHFELRLLSVNVVCVVILVTLNLRGKEVKMNFWLTLNSMFVIINNPEKIHTSSPAPC